MTGSTYPYMIIGSTGWVYYRRSSTVRDDTWAINLNEALADVGELTTTASHLRPGWVNENLPSNFKYRPIGVPAEGNVPLDSGPCYQIVKMHAISIEKLIMKTVNTIPADLVGKKLYYFEATNILDGIC